MKDKKFCAHRGLSALCPENTLPAFGAAIALGADEIEFDIRLTKDKKLVVSHDDNLSRIAGMEGKIGEYKLSELRAINIGEHLGWDVSFCTPEEIFATFGGKTVFNIHLKECGDNGEVIEEIVCLGQKYGCMDSMYFAATDMPLKWAKEKAPYIPRTAIQFPKTEDIYALATKYECSRVQFWLGMFDKALIDKLHGAGIKCNLFYADSAEDYTRYFNMGIDTLLTNRMDLAARFALDK